MNNWISNKSMYVAIVALSLSVAVLFFVFEEKPEYKIERVLKYSFTVNNPTNNLVKKSTMWAYAPVTITSSQMFESIDVSQPYSLVEDDLGNQRLMFEIDNIPPYGSKIITVKVSLSMSDQPNSADVDDMDIYVNAEQYIESDNEEIIKATSTLRVSDELLTAKNIYTWIVDHMEYKGFVAEDRGALFAFNNGEGDCTEYAHLFTAMARSTGLATRTIAGFVNNENAHLKAKDYHNWSEVRIDGRWWLVDAQKEVFMQDHSHYVAMRIISSSINNEITNSQEYFHVDSPLVAVMN